MFKLTGWRYETRLVIILSLTFGIAFFDRNVLNYLIPFISGLQAPLFIMVGCALLATLLSFAIKETAPIKLKQVAMANA